MGWVKLDDQARQHRKLLSVGPVAAWLWTCGLMYCNAQKARDGFIPTLAVSVLYPIHNVNREVSRLVSVGLWIKTEDGYVVHDYHDYQPTAEEAAATSAMKSAAGRSGGLRSGASRRSKNEARGEAESKHGASLLPKPVPSRPDPVLEDPPNPRGGSDSPERMFDIGTASIWEAVETYGDAVSSVTGNPFTFPRGAAPLEQLRDGLNVHSRTDSVRAGLLWLKASVGEWVASHREQARFTRGWAPEFFLAWLNAGRPKPSPSRATHNDTRPPPDDLNGFEIP
jgi:hypothetical protein